MPDCFISYCSDDAEFAALVHSELSSRNLTVFMAKLSLSPGDDWTERVWATLNDSDWVVFLASRSACASSYVQQEIGGALATGKRVIPVVWDIDPAELPGWVPRKQALDLRNLSLDEIKGRIAALAEVHHAKKENAALLVVGLLAGLLLLGSKE